MIVTSSNTWSCQNIDFNSSVVHTLVLPKYILVSGHTHMCVTSSNVPHVTNKVGFANVCVCVFVCNECECLCKFVNCAMICNSMWVSQQAFSCVLNVCKCEYHTKCHILNKTPLCVCVCVCTQCVFKTAHVCVCVCCGYDTHGT